MRRARPDSPPKWPLPVGIFVALGIAATIALAVIESGWG